VSAVLARFEGTQPQVPPMYSALKQRGEPLYRLARAGITVERNAREIRIDSLRLLALEGTVLELETLCSKGTYVRVLGEDLAQALGTLGHVRALRRLSVEPFAQAAMHPLAALEQADAAAREAAVLPPDAPLDSLPRLSFEGAETVRILRGQRVYAASTARGRVRLYDARRGFLGIGESDGQGSVQPRRLLNLAEPL
jgi:tRNA pseudouridine55 synthase